MRLLLFIGLVLAIWRVTRLLILDTLPPVKAVREWFVGTFGEVDELGNLLGGRGPRWLHWLTHSLAYVWTCPWCMSAYVGAALVALADVQPGRLDVPYPWLIVAIGSLAAGLGGQVESEHEQRYALRQRDIERG